MSSHEETRLVPSEAICAGMVYFTSLKEASANPSLLAYIRIIERAWDDFGLTGVLCVDRIPAVYFKNLDFRVIPLPSRRSGEPWSRSLIVKLS